MVPFSFMQIKFIYQFKFMRAVTTFIDDGHQFCVINQVDLYNDENQNSHCGVVVHMSDVFYGAGAFQKDFKQVNDEEVMFYIDKLRELRKAG